MSLATVRKENDTFEDLGLEVTRNEVEVGETYPIFGMITEIIDDTPGHVMVEINRNILARINVDDPQKIITLKSRALESAIFVSRILAKQPKIEVECKTIILGKSQEYNA